MTTDPTPAQVLELLAEELQLRADVLALAQRMANNEGDPFDNLDQLNVLQSRLKNAEFRRKQLDPATLRAQAEALAEREAECERLRAKVEVMEQAERMGWAAIGLQQLRILHDFDSVPERKRQLGEYLAIRQALTPTQEAQQ